MIRFTDDSTVDDFINALLMNDKVSDQSSVLPFGDAVNAVSPVVTSIYKYHPITHQSPSSQRCISRPHMLPLP